MGGEGSFEARFRNAVEAAWDDFGPEIRALGLKFRVRLRVLWVSTPLRSAPYKIFSKPELEAGLAACQRLQAARVRAIPHRWDIPYSTSVSVLAGAWSKLQREYLN